MTQEERLIHKKEAIRLIDSFISKQHPDYKFWKEQQELTTAG